MKGNATDIAVLTDPSAHELTTDPVSWLRRLQHTTWVDVTGKDRTRNRVITTLLHGNEPSGLIALHHWLVTRQVPMVNCHFLVASVKAALQAPVFSRRMLTGQRDLNRCFREPFSDSQGQLASQIIARLQQLKPECIVDIHNTSGTGPSFAVATDNKPYHRSLVRWFCRRMIVTDFRLGSLMEIDGGCPAVTIECGGPQDSESEAVAFNGIKAITNVENLFAQADDNDLEVLSHPVRVELRPGVTIAYSETLREDVDITLWPDIEHLNHGVTSPDTCLGWVGQGGLNLLRADDAAGIDQIATLLREENGWLYPAQAMQLFMATTNPAIARTDCLFYLVPSNVALTT